MRNPFRRQPQTPPVPAYSFCESTLATATSPWHIRRVGPEGLKPGGGVPNPALCERDLRHGWDLKTEVTVESVQQGMVPRQGDGRVWVCNRCAGAFLATHGVPVTT